MSWKPKLMMIVETAVNLWLKEQDTSCVHKQQGTKVNAASKWLAPLLRIWEAADSNLGLESDLDFSGFPQYLQANAGIVA